MVVTLFRMRLLLATILAGAALAATAPDGARAADRQPAAEQKPQTVPEDTAPGRSGGSQEPLGQKLDRTGGVLHPPPGVDPRLTIPPPRAEGKMPVIPPPGTPGGDPGPRPK
jgi:glucose/arabinose dehydrogenase